MRLSRAESIDTTFHQVSLARMIFRTMRRPQVLVGKVTMVSETFQTDFVVACWCVAISSNDPFTFNKDSRIYNWLSRFSAHSLSCNLHLSLIVDKEPLSHDFPTLRSLTLL